MFQVNKSHAKGGSGTTQFGRAQAELKIEILCANSSQAKDRVERANRTVQDRLVTELRLAGVSTIEAGDAFLAGFVASFDERFTVRTARTDDLHRKLGVAASRISVILCHQEQRCVGAQLTLLYDRKQIILECNEASEALSGQYVELCDFRDRPLNVRCKAHSLP